MASSGKGSEGKRTAKARQTELAEESSLEQQQQQQQPLQQQQQQRKYQQQQRPLRQPEQLPQRKQEHHHQLLQQPQQQPQQNVQQQQQEQRQDQQQQPQQQPPRSCLKRSYSDKSFAGPDAKQSMRTTPASSIGQRESKTSRLTEEARVGEGKTAWAGLAPEDAVPPAGTLGGTQAGTKEEKLEAAENLCVVHNPPPVGVYYSGSGFPLCTCKQRPTWFDLFLGRSAEKRADSEDSKGFVHGDSCTSIEAMHKVNWSETSDTASRKLRTMFRKFHSMEDNSVRDDVLPSTAQAICFAFGVLVLVVGTGALLYFVWEVDHEVQVSAVRGRYAGRTRVVGSRHVYEFLGISFARDPVRSMRFQQSLAVDRHMLLTKALSMKPGCVQDKDYAMADRDGPVTERCLHLNIWTPMLPGHRCRSECELRTVLVVLVGRDFQFGGNSHSLYRGELLASHANAVVVVPNYRLGPFGFLNGRIVDIKGNAGLHDQKIALDWVLENIEFFGGNPDDIVPVGHDAGAISIMHHLLDTKLHWVQRVKRLVLHTSSFFRPYRENTKNALQNTLQLGRLCVCHPEEGVDIVVECLQSIPASRLKAAARHAYRLAPVFVPSKVGGTAPSAAMRIQNSSSVRPWLRDKEFLLGNVADEGSFEYSMILQRLRDLKYVLPQGSFPNVTAEILNFLAELRLGGQIEDIIGEYRTGYRNETFNEADMWKNILGDILVYCPMQYLAEILSALGNKVYTFVLETGLDFRGRARAQRYDDLHLLFGTPLRFKEGYYEADKEHTITFLMNWATFAKTGKLPDVASGRQAWPVFNAKDPKTVLVKFGGKSEIVKTFRAEQCDFLRRYILPKRRN